MTRARVIGTVAIAAVIAFGAAFSAVSATGQGEKRETMNLVRVTLAGTGSGTVVSTPAGISCPGQCSYIFNTGYPVKLTATPAAGSVFAGFTGDQCVGSASPCTFELHGDPQVTATFNLAPPNDADGDGVPDGADNCPSVAGPANNAGCPKEATPPVAPPVDPDEACDRAKTKLAKAKERLAELKADEASDRKIENAKEKVKKAKRAAKKACA